MEIDPSVAFAIQILPAIASDPSLPAANGKTRVSPLSMLINVTDPESVLETDRILESGCSPARF